MSTPNEQPPHGQDPSQSEPSATPAGYQPPPGYDTPAADANSPMPGGYQQPPQGYQQPPQQGYQQPQEYQQPPQQNYQQPPQGYQQPQAGADSSFQMPNRWPQNVNDVVPVGGFSGMFNLTGLPSLVKASYIIWLVVGVLSFLGALLSFVLSLGFFRGSNIGVSVVSLLLAVAVVLVAVKYKEGFSWARIVLSAIAALSLILTFFGGGIGWLGILAVIFMWLPESSAWLNSRPQNARS